MSSTLRSMMWASAIAWCALAGGAQAQVPAGAADAAGSTFATELAEWRARRLASITSPTGWLTPVGLYWVKEGRNSFGRAKRNAFMLDSPSLPARAGEFELRAGQVRFRAARGSGITLDGKPVDDVVLASDKAERPSELIAGTLHITLIDRVGHLGIRVRDTVSPGREHFRGLQYFPDRPDWNIDTRFEPYEPARVLTIVNILGMEDAMSSPGAIVFERDGRTWRLDAVLEEPGATQLWVMFSDGTSGRESYGAGRYLYLALPKDGHVRVDFNRAYNPPCAFTAFATCPLPPPQNQLSLRIDAGELSYSHGDAAPHAAAETH